MSSLTLKAPAKVNLFLEVTGKRPDGYHELAMLFAKTSLCDTLHLQVQPAQQEQLHLQITGPGLGGGSSDAGTVLRGLCQLFGKDPLELLPQATRLGADVPVFLYPEVFLRAEGIGEKLTPVPAAGPLPWAVLVYPDQNVPPQGGFARLQLPRPDDVLTKLSNLDKLIEYLRQGVSAGQWHELLFNRLEEAVLPYECAVRDVKEDFLALGACPLMSGSGSTVFVLTPNRTRADNLAEQIKKQGRKVFVVHFGGTPNENN